MNLRGSAPVRSLQASSVGLSSQCLSLELLRLPCPAVASCLSHDSLQRIPFLLSRHRGGCHTVEFCGVISTVVPWCLAPLPRSWQHGSAGSFVATSAREFPSVTTSCSSIRFCVYGHGGAPIMEPFDFQRYPLCFMLQDALIILTPVFLIVIGVLFWPS
jgi:hypothetical protein